MQSFEELLHNLLKFILIALILFALDNHYFLLADTEIINSSGGDVGFVERIGESLVKKIACEVFLGNLLRIRTNIPKEIATPSARNDGAQLFDS